MSVVLVIGHRGACGSRPEHTLASYELAARQGAHFIEPDLVPTQDGVLVARHENEIGGTTDVATRPEFAGRRTTKIVDGATLTGWFAEDFTLAELRTLRAVERIPDVRPQNTMFDGRFTVPTLEEILELRAALSRELGREIGIYPETKHPAFFRALGLPLEEPLARALDGLGRQAVFVQSFDPDSLQRLRALTDAPLVRLVGAGPVDLEDIARHADAVGPAKQLVIPRDADGRSLPATTFVRDAHAAGLAVHAYTFRAENRFLPAELRRGTDPNGHGDLAAELDAFRAAGVDGVFIDQPDYANVLPSPR